MWNHPQKEVYVLDNVYAYSRGDCLVALTNKGDQVHIQPQVSWSEGTQVCNIFYPTTDCQAVKGGKIDLYLTNGEQKIYMPKTSAYFDEHPEEIKII